MADRSEAIQIDPKYVEALINRGFVAYQSKQHKSAIADYQAKAGAKAAKADAA